MSRTAREEREESQEDRCLMRERRSRAVYMNMNKIPESGNLGRRITNILRRALTNDTQEGSAHLRQTIDDAQKPAHY